MSYKENPKTKGSGIICTIPQIGRCPNGCKDCFFQSGKSYKELEPDPVFCLGDIYHNQEIVAVRALEPLEEN